MPRMIILTAPQATAVRGQTSPISRLDPVQLPDLRWALPAAVLQDPAHAIHHSLLATLPQEDIAPAG